IQARKLASQGGTRAAQPAPVARVPVRRSQNAVLPMGNGVSARRGIRNYFFFHRKGGRSRSSPFTTFGLTPSNRPRGAVSKESSVCGEPLFTPSFSLGGSGAALEETSSS